MLALKKLEVIREKRELTPYMIPSQQATVYVDGRPVKLHTLSLCEQIALNVHISVMSGKLLGLLAISTACSNNENCLLAIQDPNSPCYECFAFSTLAQYNTTREHVENNTRVLNARELSQDDIDALVSVLQKSANRSVRFEFCGDISTVMQGFNYVRIMRADPSINYGLWSKLPHIWDRVFAETGKPQNCNFILSACGKNQTVYPYSDMYDFISAYFVVCDADRIDSVAANWISQGYTVKYCQCANGSCANTDICGICYKRDFSRVDGKPIIILEKLRH